MSPKTNSNFKINHFYFMQQGKAILLMDHEESKNMTQMLV